MKTPAPRFLWLLLVLVGWRDGNAEAGAGGAAADTGRVAPPGKLYVYKTSHGEPQRLEVYFPPDHQPATARAPALLLFHGGGWSRGSRDQFRLACAYFASRGLVAATADYRMHTPEERKRLTDGQSYKRICVTDAKSAIRWMKQQAVELGLDPRRLIVGGGSAGGHIAVLATINPGLDDPSDPKGFDTSVAAYVLFNPAFAPKDPDAQINVMSHLRAGFPPAIAFFGSEDRWKPGWEAAHDKLKALGNATAELWIARGHTHGFYLEPPWREVTLAAADQFLVRQGLLKGKPTVALPPPGERLELLP